MTTVLRPASGMSSRSSDRVRRGRHRTAWLLAALVGLLFAVLLSVCVGSQPTSIQEVWHALVRPTGTDLDVTIRQIRWPRTVTGLMAGACLGVAGLLVQGHTRNAVADPGLLGINQGAALAIVASVALTGQVAATAQATVAFVGALAASALVFLIGTASRFGTTPVTLVLAGAAVSALCGGLVTGIVLLNDAALETLRFWQIGSLAGRDEALEPAVPFVVIGLALATVNVAALNALALGEDVASALGVRVSWARATGVAATTLLAGAAVTLAGPIAFAGLLVPHLARAMVGLDYRWLLPLAALLGPMLLLVADTIGRVIARPGELSVGVVLAVVGAPFFVLLARRRKLVTL